MSWLLPDIIILENRLEDILIFVAILLVGVFFKPFCAKLLSRQSFRIFKAFSRNKFGEVFVDLLRKPIERIIFLLVIYYAFERLSFPTSWNLAPVDKIGLRWLVLTVWQIILTIYVCRMLLCTTDFFTHVLINREESPISPELGMFLKELIKVVIVILCVFAGLRFVFHINITALIASLGIGGLAVALAAQDTLANLLGSFVIYLDKPFKAGDYIESGEIKGVIEHVGFRTTRIRTLEKSLLTVPNKKLIDTALNNITMSEARRVKFNIALTYSSKSNQILSIITDIKQLLDEHELVSKDITVRFADFDTSSLNILVIYFVMSNDYDMMIRVKEELNIRILEIVEKNDCRFAYPTQTLYLHQ
ncbi:MAG: mechanosensitive ion channel family protein [Bacteroidetes bacterium]|nr:MAG: mechanosensitive ion channel family protein [Bacteroidota bacterium]